VVRRPWHASVRNILNDQAALPFTRAQGYDGSINMTAYSGLQRDTGQSNCAAAKASIAGFTKAVAKEVARSGCHRLRVAPERCDGHGGDHARGELTALTEAIPMSRFADPT
jgi:NAD(P)-dependent dehydrogenase (short-subunit alcohol dehydrogenase family)